MRVTPQREALLAAIWRSSHATAESLVADLDGSDDAVNTSTVYRSLDAMERIGLVRHAHLGTGGPTYHIAVESPHIHLQCNLCGKVSSLDAAAAQAFVARLAESTGFEADVTHAAIYGRCAECVVAGHQASSDDGV